MVSTTWPAGTALTRPMSPKVRAPSSSRTWFALMKLDAAETTADASSSKKQTGPVSSRPPARSVRLLVLPTAARDPSMSPRQWTKPRSPRTRSDGQPLTTSSASSRPVPLRPAGKRCAKMTADA